MLTQETVHAIVNLQALYPDKRSALIPALHLAQKEQGYLPEAIQAEVATLFGIDQTEVHAVVTFYDMFFEEPMGKHLIHVCKNISCMLRGCDRLLKSVQEKTANDPDVTVIPSECLGACDKAPMMIVGEEVVGPVKLEDLDEILKRAKNG